MTEIVFFIEQIAFGLYILSLGGLLAMAFRLNRARRELVIAQYKLEREYAQVRQASAITYGGLLIEFMVAVWAVANVMAPTIRDIRLDANADPNQGLERFITSTPGANAAPSLGGGGGTGAEGPFVFATPVPTATAVGTIVPEAPDVVGCPREDAWLHIPGNGQLVFEATTVEGTANISDFSFYRFEIKPARSGAEFSPIGGDYTVPVVDGPLGQLLPFPYPDGEYRFRLSVFDKTNMLRAVCEITIWISARPPTPTPIGGQSS